MRASVWGIVLLVGCAQLPEPRGTGDLGLVIERAAGRVLLVETSRRTAVARIEGLGDLSHASVVYSRDGRYGYVFGRDGGLSKVDLLAARVVARVVQAGNAIGGAISQDGRLIAVANYEPGGVRLFDAATLEPLAEIPATWGDGKQRAKVVGIADAPGNRFVWSLFEAGEIWIADATDPRKPAVTRLANVGKQPYDALVTPDGRHYIAGLYGEDGLAIVDLWSAQPAARRILSGYGRGEEPLPVYKMPHLRGWAVAGRYAFLPAIGRHEVLVVDTRDWQEVARIPVVEPKHPRRLVRGVGHGGELTQQPKMGLRLRCQRLPPRLPGRHPPRSPARQCPSRRRAQAGRAAPADQRAVRAGGQLGPDPERARNCRRHQPQAAFARRCRRPGRCQPGCGAPAAERRPLRTASANGACGPRSCAGAGWPGA